ncbi:hypothetical protein K2173_020765 [Erythroxylum novogranatense]|uniref:FLZ-type domain-containing protein n=1 Tax=Erythroxylum novogranatense TaxID=1862640 RepID=A0AAV8TNL1_9ROSI|nr:hypothetical protein K2173_020765 [Erythroxylum novogranatense]
MSQFVHKMEKRRPSINLSIFNTLTESFSIDKPSKSPRTFEDGGVGLGIVAAMNGSINQESAKVTSLALSTSSKPSKIVSLAKPAANFRGGVGLLNLERDGIILDESDESYTCVISYVGNNVIKKHVYHGFDDSVSVFDVSPGLFYASSSPPPPKTTMNIDGRRSGGGDETGDLWTNDFLSSCYLCNKLLHGLDVFMYRGEKGFCSAECRDKQIRSEDYREKCGSGGIKARDYSMSPCSSPQVFFAGVAAA